MNNIIKKAIHIHHGVHSCKLQIIRHIVGSDEIDHRIVMGIRSFDYFMIPLQNINLIRVDAIKILEVVLILLLPNVIDSPILPIQEQHRWLVIHPVQLQIIDQ